MTHSPLWRVLSPGISNKEFAAKLTELSNEDLRSTCVDYFQSRADVAFAIQESGRAQGASEDILDDVAEAVIRRGRDVYESVRDGTGELPERSTWSALEREALRGVIRLAWEARFSDDLFDAVEHGP
ncbi:MAG: hypothetical protein JNK82_23095 [Myxococcaceae bacterium]|nr:hypothetical protein [Myxococcaceae bacterium]